MIDGPEMPPCDLGLLAKLRHQFLSFAPWKDAISSLGADDVLIVQYPPMAGCFSFGHALRKFGGSKRVVLLLHDLESLRGESGTSYIDGVYYAVAKREEGIALRSAWKIISHNESMSRRIADMFNISKSKIVNLGLFDYLIPGDAANASYSLDKPIVIAGNLSAKKSGYIGDLPKGIAFNLYGPNYSMYQRSNLNYHGSFNSRDLPGVIEGSFGLVWDGPSAYSCEGPFGEYLKSNNPHKASLYLSMGLPIIVWEQSAIAELVVGRGAGMAVRSLIDLPEIVKKTTSIEYEKMKENATVLSDQLRSGSFTLDCLDRCLVSRN